MSITQQKYNSQRFLGSAFSFTIAADVNKNSFYWFLIKEAAAFHLNDLELIYPQRMCFYPEVIEDPTKLKKHNANVLLRAEA